MKPRFNYFKAPDTDSQKGRHIIFYCEWGNIDSKNIVICVHGLSRNSRDFDYLASALSDKYRVICIDVVGRGKSEWLGNKAQYDYETYITDVVNLIDHLSLSKFYWIGTSMGGIMGMIMASRYPHLVKGLVLNDIGPIIPGNAIERILRYVGSSYEFSNRVDAERALRERMKTFGVLQEEHWRHLLKHSIMKKLNGKYTFTYDPNIVPAPKLLTKLKGMMSRIIPGIRKSSFPAVDLTDIWEKINCPILALRGGNSDVLTSKTAEEMQKTKENLQLVEFADIGHAPMLMEDYQIKIVRDWLTKKES
jgi:hypothetical protein